MLDLGDVLVCRATIGGHISLQKAVHHAPFEHPSVRGCTLRSDHGIPTVRPGTAMQQLLLVCLKDWQQKVVLHNKGTNWGRHEIEVGCCGRDNVIECTGGDLERIIPETIHYSLHKF